jgi:carbamoyl-phosphate synthase large subunit
MIKVLFTGGGGAGNEAIYRLLKDKYELHFADADVRNINPVIPKDRQHQIPFANDELFIPHMIQLSSVIDVDLIVPGVDEELLLFASNYKLFLPAELLLPDKNYISIMTDKYNTIKILRLNGIKVPDTYMLMQYPSNGKFPCICKPVRGRGSRDVVTVNTPINMRYADSMIAQEKIFGTEYTVQMVCSSLGKLCAIVPVKIDIKRGITILAEIDDNIKVIEACQKIHDAIPTKGCYNIQLMLTSDGEVYPFEINPRISTTFCMAIAAGIDPISCFQNGNNSNNLLTFNKVKLDRHRTNYFTEVV